MPESVINNEKNGLIYKLGQFIKSEQFSVTRTDFNKPWGAYYALSQDDAKKFIDIYYNDVAFDNYENLSPKFLIVAPGKRLSWQYHNKRAELWRVVEGPVGIKISDSNEEPKKTMEISDGGLIDFGAQKRHRLIGLNNWGVVAEIWRHKNPSDLSTEDDIVRLQDDFAR